MCCSSAFPEAVRISGVWLPYIVPSPPASQTLVGRSVVKATVMVILRYLWGHSLYQEIGGEGVVRPQCHVECGNN